MRGTCCCLLHTGSTRSACSPPSRCQLFPFGFPSNPSSSPSWPCAAARPFSLRVLPRATERKHQRSSHPCARHGRRRAGLSEGILQSPSSAARGSTREHPGAAALSSSCRSLFGHRHAEMSALIPLHGVLINLVQLASRPVVSAASNPTSSWHVFLLLSHVRCR
jgi:hypothetical protein